MVELAVKKTVFIVESNLLLQQRIAALVQQIEGLEVVGSTEHVLPNFPDIHDCGPQIILLDMLPLRKQWKETLTSLCQTMPQSIVLCMNDVWLPEDISHVLATGVSACLTKPFGRDELVEVLKAVYKEKQALADSKRGKVIALFSPKGGYGKSSIAVNMAIGLAEETGKRVGMVDANFQFGDLAVFCDVTPEASAYEATRDLNYLTPAALDKYFTSYTEDVKVLAAPVRPEQGDLIGGAQITGVLAMARELYPYLIVDTPAGFTEVSMAIMQEADIVYVLCAVNSGLEVEHLRRSLDYFQELGYRPEKLRVVINRVSQRSLAVLREMEKQLGHPVVTLLPNDFKLAVAASNQGRPMIAAWPESGLVRGIMDVVKNVVHFETER